MLGMSSGGRSIQQSGQAEWPTMHEYHQLGKQNKPVDAPVSVAEVRVREGCFETMLALETRSIPARIDGRCQFQAQDDRATKPLVGLRPSMLVHGGLPHS